MPYNTLADLPESVRDNLPRHAQAICKAAVVKKRYIKNEEGRWVEQ
jgi:cation transport regulator ChaB